MIVGLSCPRVKSAAAPESISAPAPRLCDHTLRIQRGYKSDGSGSRRTIIGLKSNVFSRAVTPRGVQRQSPPLMGNVGSGGGQLVLACRDRIELKPPVQLSKPLNNMQIWVGRNRAD